MPIATFTLSDPASADFRFSVVQQSNKKVDVLRTVLKLDGLEAEVPLLLEEKYLQERDGLLLLLRLRLEPALTASRAPVFVRLRGSVEKHIKHNTKYSVLCTRGVTLLREGEEPSDEAISSACPITKEEHLEVLESLPIRPLGLKGRHELANEWGPHRLWRGYAQLAGIDTEPEWSGSAFLKLRRQEYYAYLLALAALRSTKRTRPSQVEREALADYDAFLDGYTGPPIRILLLDDEIEAGWDEAVRAVLEREGKLTVDISLRGVDFKENRRDVEATATSGEWDLVLADLRTEKGERGTGRSATHLSGASLINKIKEAHPQTAVVVFTASNKAWSVQELRELGTDGYWVKESPEFGVDDAYSRANASRLLTVVRKALQPRIEARPIWMLRTDLARLAGDPKYRRGWIPSTMPERSEFEIKCRLNAILERLSRAYGFLVLARSRYEEDKFEIRGCDLAFLTLWSSINEVDELYFHGPKSKSRNDKLAERMDAAFSWRNPGSEFRWETYWRIQGGKETTKPTSVPERIGRESIREKICPTNNLEPVWPGTGADTRRITWALKAAADSSLAKQFVNLRRLRNKLEEEHGRTGDREEASIEDVHAICDIWRSLLVTPYDKAGS
jgi:DNA-binding NarL/FixJ family response regulator